MPISFVPGSQKTILEKATDIYELQHNQTSFYLRVVGGFTWIEWGKIPQITYIHMVDLTTHKNFS
jgi:hypothetical protein